MSRDSELISYLGRTIVVTSGGYTVHAGGGRARFGSMADARLYIRRLRRLAREQAAA